ncbi:MAG: hypothetical protein M3463_08790 [Verrucomicrobiota bacterium]|nr:hypothetical protein [Verrucomicrobiota bacterium]
MQPLALFVTIPSFILALLLGGCDAPPPPNTSGPAAEERRAATTPANTREFKDRQMAFLNRLREADPQKRTIDRAFLNEQNELGLILDRSVEMDKIRPLMTTMLTQMAAEFPGEDLTVLAYTPSDPPRKIGTARLNARTRDMTYTPEG